jgi:hypothetical protein
MDLFEAYDQQTVLAQPHERRLIDRRNHLVRDGKLPV